MLLSTAFPTPHRAPPISDSRVRGALVHQPFWLQHPEASRASTGPRRRRPVKGWNLLSARSCIIDVSDY